MFYLILSGSGISIYDMTVGGFFFLFASHFLGNDFFFLFSTWRKALEPSPPTVPLPLHDPVLSQPPNSEMIF